MEAWQVGVLVTSQVLLLVTLAGLWWRRRLRRLWLLPVHLVAMAVVQVLEYRAPEVFFGWTFWGVREALLHGLTLGIVGEIAWRVFAMVPQARQRARRWVATALLLTFALLVLIPWQAPEYVSAPWLYVMVVEVLPRLALGAAVVGLAVGFAMVWGPVPPDSLHWPVLFGLTAYLFLYAVVLGLLPPHVYLYALPPVGYTSMLAWWAWAAWAKEKPRGSARARRFVHPWLREPDPDGPDVVG